MTLSAMGVRRLRQLERKPSNELTYSERRVRDALRAADTEARQENELRAALGLRPTHG